MHVVDHHRRGIHRVGGWSHSIGGCVRSLDLECPQVRFWVLARAIPQRQTGQEQHLLLIIHGTECRDVHAHGIDTVHTNTNTQRYGVHMLKLHNCKVQ